MSSAAAIAIPAPSSTGRPAPVAWSVALALGCALVAVGTVSSVPHVVVGGAAVFLVFAVASDVRAYRLPNLLTLPALLGALLASPWIGGTTGPLEAAAGAALGFALLVGPYAIGGVGAGDVKAVMALGAWLGPETTLGAFAWSMISAGIFGLALLAARKELVGYARRWARTLATTLSLRRLTYEPPVTGSGAASGIPFAVALTIGLAIQWYGGSPW